VIKIDVEGFGCDVLDGVVELIRATRPFLMIDLHDDPRMGR